jgi:hypothetical protein
MEEIEPVEVVVEKFANFVNKERRRSFYIGYTSAALAVGTIVTVQYGWKKLKESRKMREWRNSLQTVKD